MKLSKNFATITVAILLSCFNSSLELDFNKQQHNPNSDFLAHEAGGSVWSSKTTLNPYNNTQNTQQVQDYNKQFPSLGQQSTRVTTPSPKSGLRDYVAPQWPSQKSQSAGSHSQGLNNPNKPFGNQESTNSHTSTTKEQPSGKRDYVAPQFTTQNPLQGNAGGKVKDLINFYDGKTKDQNGPQKMPSYSAITQNNNQGSGTTNNVKPVTLPTPPGHTTKPLSFSSVVANKPSTTITSKPGVMAPTPKPVLPSSLVNSNKNNNQVTSNKLTDSDIQTLSEELLRKDTNNAAKYITINYQQKTSSQSKEDKAPLALLRVAPEAWNIPTIQKLVPLLDNYERDTSINEYVTAQERNEENAFMDVLMNTAVIRHLMSFLKDRGYVSPDPRLQRDFLKQLWFGLYSRGKGKISSSGFEHVFVSELKNGDVQGLHSWIYFAREEAANRVNYLGYLKYVQLEDRGMVLKLHFSQQGADKPVNSLFIGTSPELEIALYTLCFVTRADNDCNIKLAAKDVNIVTHTFRYRSKNYIGSAYPQI